jgi:hypothetical protein
VKTPDTRLEFVICPAPASQHPRAATAFRRYARTTRRWARITAGLDGTIRLRDSFGAQRPKWKRKVGNNFEVVLKKGLSLEATLPKPQSTPIAPTDAGKGLRKLDCD